VTALAMHKCYDLPRVVLTPPRHPLLKMKRLSVEALARYPLITYDDEFIGHSKVYRAFAARGLTPNVVLSAIDSDVMKAYVELGIGVAIVARMAFEPPQRLVRALGETAPSGDDWLEKLPEAARQAVALRELTVERVQVPGGRSSLVVLVRRPDGTPAVLKLAPPRARPESERAALAHWGGTGAVQLVEPFTTEGVLLLERLHPDVSVRSLPEAKALLEAAGTLRRLWVEPPGEHVVEDLCCRR